jgi:large subunit ribosomal protein L17
MRHGRAGWKLNRSPAHRRALFRNLVTALLEHERIRTTETKAKAIRRLADRMVTLGKRGSLHARRQALAFVSKPTVVRKLFDELAPRFANRPGGYTRVVRLAVRRGDAARLAIIELTERTQPAAGATAGEKGAARKPGRRGGRGAGAAHQHEHPGGAARSRKRKAAQGAA